MNHSTEYWRQSPFEGLQISDHGRLRDPASGEIIETKAYATKPGGSRYMRFRKRYLHEMVLTTFDRPARLGEQCRHLNGNSLDNRLENLAWGTPSEDNYDRVSHGTHQHAKRDNCKYGHPLDGKVFNEDGSVKQRICLTCRRAHNRRMKEKAREDRQTCPQGHPFDGVRYNADGTVRQRYCKTCTAQQLAKGRKTKAANRTHCPQGHPLDGVNRCPDGTVKQRYCKTCNRDRNRAQKAAEREANAAETAARREWEAEDRQEFCLEFAAFIRDNGLDQYTVRDVLGSNLCSISQWVNGHAAPRPNKRKEVMAKLERYVQ
jgi:hypothetical protein